MKYKVFFRGHFFVEGQSTRIAREKAESVIKFWTGSERNAFFEYSGIRPLKKEGDILL